MIGFCYSKPSISSVHKWIFFCTFYTLLSTIITFQLVADRDQIRLIWNASICLQYEALRGWIHDLYYDPPIIEADFSKWQVLLSAAFI